MVRLVSVNIDTPIEKQEQYVLNDEEVRMLSNWALTIEEHYQKPMDIEWAKDAAIAGGTTPIGT